MKKIIFFAAIMLLISAAASAQIGARGKIGRRQCASNNISPIEKRELGKDVVKLRAAQRMANRDGVITPREKVRIHRFKAETRRDLSRYRHNRV